MTKPIKVEVVEERGERFLLQVYSDGKQERVPIAPSVTATRRDRRLSAKVAWYWDLTTGRRKFY
jgi:hypothetical protein